jgi:hypothetical protein
VLTNTSAGARPEALALELARAAIDLLPEETEPWLPGEPAPDEAAPLLGLWWSEGHKLVFAWRRGRLEARLLDGAPGRDVSSFERMAADLYRCVEGRERGELLRVVRDGDGSVRKLYFATYPLLREPSTF